MKPKSLYVWYPGSKDYTYVYEVLKRRDRHVLGAILNYLYWEALVSDDTNDNKPKGDKPLIL